MTEKGSKNGSFVCGRFHLGVILKNFCKIGGTFKIQLIGNACGNPLWSFSAAKRFSHRKNNTTGFCVEFTKIMGLPLSTPGQKGMPCTDLSTFSSKNHCLLPELTWRHNTKYPLFYHRICIKNWIFRHRLPWGKLRFFCCHAKVFNIIHRFFHKQLMPVEYAF